MISQADTYRGYHSFRFKRVTFPPPCHHCLASNGIWLGLLGKHLGMVLGVLLSGCMESFYDLLSSGWAHGGPVDTYICICELYFHVLYRLPPGMNTETFDKRSTRTCPGLITEIWKIWDFTLELSKTMTWCYVCFTKIRTINSKKKKNTYRSSMKEEEFWFRQFSCTK